MARLVAWAGLMDHDIDSNLIPSDGYGNNLFRSGQHTCQLMPNLHRREDG